MHSPDRGRSWIVCETPVHAAGGASGIFSLAFFDSRRGVAVGLAGTFVSSDSGESWTQVDSIALNALRFSGASGWAAGPRGRVARWTP